MNNISTDHKQNTLDEFRQIIKELRAETGCPWDKKQTHGSMTLCMLEEAAETVSGIKLYEKTGNPDSMKEELGDLLMNIVLQAQIAEEEGLFTLDDVIGDISAKMIRRHPHVFEPDGTPLHGKEPNPEHLKSWQEIKAEEKKNQTYSESKRKKQFRKKLMKLCERML